MEISKIHNKFLYLLITKVVGAVVGFLLLKAVLHYYGASALALYSEYRRYSVFLLIFLLVGYPMTVSVHGVRDASIVDQILVPIIIILFFLFFCFLVLPEGIYFFLFSSALGLISINYAIDRSKSDLIFGSIWLLILGGLLPLLLTFISDTFNLFLIYYFSVVLFFLAYRLRSFDLKNFRVDVSFFRKSILRIPRELFQSVLPFVMVISSKNNQAGYVALILSIITGGYILLAPVNLIFLEQAAIRKVNFKSIKLILTTLIITFLVFILYFRLIPFINNFYFNSNTFEAFLKEALIFIPPYFFYMTYRVVLDISESYKSDVLISLLSIILYFISIINGLGVFLSASISYLLMLSFIFYLIFFKNE